MTAYSVSAVGEILDVTGYCVLLAIFPASGRPVRLRSFSIGQYSGDANPTQWYGDAGEVEMPITIGIYQGATPPIGGVTPSISKLDENDRDPTFTVSALADNGVTGGYGDSIEDPDWNLRRSPMTRQWPIRKVAPHARPGNAINIFTTGWYLKVRVQINAIVEEV